MWTPGLRTTACLVVLATSVCAASLGLADALSQASNSRVAAALDNILALERPGQDGYATFWDGNKYVQCGRTRERGLRCEAVGTLMQSSLERVLTPERIGRLTTLGWRLEPAFGNYVRAFAPGASTAQVAEAILQALHEGYDADLPQIGVKTAWVASELCPPRNGPSQNLAGSVNDARSMAATAVHACAYVPKTDSGPSAPARSVDELMETYGARMKGEIQRLRVDLDLDSRVFVVFGTQIGYVQCEPEKAPPSIYCEAQSADSWPALTAVLTPERVARLHAAGYADPGRAPNYWRNYPTDQFDDAAIARELLTILHDVYGYAGLPKLKVTTE